jgi:hypothetical protein
MTDTPPDDARAGAAEAQMRRALGLHGQTQTRPAPSHSTTTTNGLHPQRRRFVQDGEVPVTVIHRDHRSDDVSGGNQLDAARQAIRTQAAARERAERLLAEAQAAIRDLQTKLAHERLAKDEAIQRADAEKQASEQALQATRMELMAERLARQNAEAIGRAAVEASEVVALANQDAAAVPTVRRPVGRPRKTAAAKPDQAPIRLTHTARKKPAVADDVTGPGKRGRPAKPRSSKPIKWWLQGP